MIIRKLEKKDVNSVFNLVKELAKYQKHPDEVSTTVEQMEIDAFSNPPLFHCLVAEKDGEIIGASIFYFMYSTWKGKKLYLEDIIITQSERGKGIGSILFEQTIIFAKENDCFGLVWQVLNWNELAINFYKKYTTKFDADWLSCQLDFQ